MSVLARTKTHDRNFFTDKNLMKKFTALKVEI